MLWWTKNGKEARSRTSPGLGWVRGRSRAVKQKVRQNHAGGRLQNTKEKFWSLVYRADDGCEYLRPLGDKRSKPRSRDFKLGEKLWAVSRLAWTLRHGPIPDGMNVCHSCDHPACVRDNHHFLGTQQDNINDMVRKGRQRGVPGNKHALGKRWKLPEEASAKMWETRRARYGYSGRKPTA